jgi:2-keto-4-pentenoate hydratase/2-oxohepta-3-ene-1,7-dioic acid hydratase in catechol pathway
MRVQVQRVDGSAVDVGTVYAIGRNYAAHARELGNAVPAPTDDPVVFLKARTAVRGLEPAPLAFPDESFHHEVEIVLLLGEDVSLGGSPGWAAVAGVALGLDLTRREVQARCKERGLPWVPAKSFAGSAVVGPFLPLSALGPGGTDDLSLSLAVGGELRQQGHIRDMLYPVPRQLGYLASLAPLEAGDLVFTGTPEGVGPIRRGDRFEMTLAAPGGRWTFAGTL